MLCVLRKRDLLFVFNIFLSFILGIFLKLCETKGYL